MSTSATVTPAQSIVLIGPVNAGKSTVGRLLAQRLELPRVSLDVTIWSYVERLGYDRAEGDRLWKDRGLEAFEQYYLSFFTDGVMALLADRPVGVIDFGAGHSIYDDPDDLRRVKQALAPYPHVVLLLPSPDPEESIQILAARRSNPNPEVVALNHRFVRHRANEMLASMIVYTKDRTPDETCDEIIRRLGRSGGGKGRSEFGT